MILKLSQQQGSNLTSKDIIILNIEDETFAKISGSISSNE